MTSGFSKWEKRQKLGFAEIFSFSISNVACNWVGDTIKRLASHASLHYPFSNEILTPKQLFDFAGVNVDGITLFFMSSREVVSNTEFLESWFATYIQRNMESPLINFKCFKLKLYNKEDIICNTLERSQPDWGWQYQNADDDWRY